MCPHQNGDALDTNPENLVAVDIKPNGVQKRGTSSVNRAQLEQQRRNPYAPRASDFLSNVCNFNIIESTLRGMINSQDVALLSSLSSRYISRYKRESSSPMPFSILRPRLLLPGPLMHSVLNI